MLVSLATEKGICEVILLYHDYHTSVDSQPDLIERNLHTTSNSPYSIKVHPAMDVEVEDSAPKYILLFD